MVVVSSLGPPKEGVRLKVDNVATFLNRKQLGLGSLYISEARVSWVGLHGQGFSLEYPHIALHAVSRNLTQFHKECLYLMIDVRLVDETPTSSEAGSDSEHEDESVGGFTEIRFAPDDVTQLDGMFAAMSECQSLHSALHCTLHEDDGGGEEASVENDEEPGKYDEAEEDIEENGASSSR